MSHSDPDTTVASLALADRLLAEVPDDTPPEVQATAALTVVRVIACRHPELAERVAHVMSHTAAELITGQIFFDTTN